MDSSIHNLCAGHRIVYSRYADDLYFSTLQPNVLQDVIKEVRELIIQHETPKLILNESKTSSVSFKYREQITGLIVTPERYISLGRSRKRRISSMLHHFKTGTLNAAQFSELKGLIAFAKDVEPNFVTRLEAKYGSETVERLFSF